jgi:ABC-type Fe3+ transport system permease subunit
MGIVIANPADRFRPRDTAVTVLGYCGGILSAAAFIALVSVLLAIGLKEFRYVFSSQSDATVSLAASLVAIAAALPIISIVGFLAAVCTTEVTTGKRLARALKQSLGLSAGIPPVVIGVAMFFVATTAREPSHLPIIAATLTVLNLPNATARFARIFEGMAPDEKEAAVAAGASEAATFFGVVAPRSTWALGAVLFSMAAQMAGETSAVVAVNAGANPRPLSALIWQFGSDPSLATTEAAACMLLVLVVAAFTLAAKACEKKSANSDPRKDG